jgi:dihydrofolate reductase
MSGEAKRRLILHMSVSLDGFSAAGRGIPGSVDHGDVRHRANLEMLGQAGLIAMGRGAYEEMAQAWATSDSPMARLINALPKVVFSTSLSAVEWENAVLNPGPVEEEIPRLKAELGGDVVVFGGPRFAHSLIRHRLVDEYRLTVHPIALGSGSPLMHGLPEPQRFEVVSSTVYADGSTVQVLRPGVTR